MTSAKQITTEILEQLPEDASIEDIQYELYVRQKIERGLSDVREGRTLTQTDVQRRVAEWRAK